jgi:hypothetical protein
MPQEVQKRATRTTTRKKEQNLPKANAAVYYTAFRSLAPETRRRLALRILKDEDLLGDLYDHFLIQAAEEEKGRVVPWEEYLAESRR